MYWKNSCLIDQKVYCNPTGKDDSSLSGLNCRQRDLYRYGNLSQERIFLFNKPKDKGMECYQKADRNSFLDGEIRRFL